MVTDNLSTALLRRANALVVLFDNEGILLFNFIGKQFNRCSYEHLNIIHSINKPLSFQNLLQEFNDYEPKSLVKAITSLIKAGALLIEGTEIEKVDSEYERDWEWGPTSGIFHFGIKDGRFFSVEEAIALQEARALKDPSPKLWSENTNYDEVIELPWPDLTISPLKLMRKRRTHRSLLKEDISQSDLAKCLFSGMGILGIGKNSKICDIPFKMTPSGGARNPYEAYVYVQRVKDLKKGIYKYSGLDNSLALVNDYDLPTPGEILGNQHWADNGAAIILLVAHFERTMWKYSDAGAYRVVLIEAGHIGQNIALMANKLDLVANPTSAIHDTIAEKTLCLDKVTHSVLYALIIGKPDLEFPIPQTD